MDKLNLQEQLATYKKRIAIMENALSATAGAFYNINLTQNLIPGTMYQVIKGKKYSINEAIGLPDNCKYWDVIEYWGNQLSADQQPAYFAFFDIDNLKKSYKNGTYHVAHTYLTKDSLGSPMLAEQNVVMYEDFLSGDLMAITYVVDLTQMQNLQTKTEVQGKLLQEDFKQIEGLASQYFALYYLDFAAETCTRYDFDEQEKGKFKRQEGLRSSSFLESFRQAILEHTNPIFRDEAIRYTEKHHIKEILKNHKRQTYRLQFLNDKDEYQWVEIVLVKLDEENAEPNKVLVAFLDIDAEERQKEEQRKALLDALSVAEHANRAKTAFLSNMSHDIRTPMNAIIGYTSLAYNRLNEPDVLRDYLDKISVSSNHLLNLINDVLDMSRIESGRIELDEKTVNLPETLNELQAIIQSDAEAKKQQLTVTLENIAYENVITDKLRLNQVLLNIVSNAIKFTPEGGKIDIHVTQHPSLNENCVVVELRVKDNGIGMSKDFQKHIFEAFVREKTSTVTGIQGTGLGMAIANNIVDMLGGTISVESEEGVGSEFTVELDCKISEVAQAAEENAPLHGETGKSNALDVNEFDFTGKHILLVEDNDLNREIAKTILEEKGLVIDTASDGIYAVEKMVEAPSDYYDLILMDIQMPQMNGFVATREIRTLHDSRKANIPIVAMTANTFNEDRRQAFEVGMNGFLAKPIDIQEVFETLNSLLG